MSLSPAVESQLIEAVRTIAREEILSRFRSIDATGIAIKSRQDDLVTAADRETERRLGEALQDILPGAAVVGEEAVAADPTLLNKIATAETCVVVDPVDGTWNFARGLAAFGVIISVARNGLTQWGMIYDPVGDDWVVARKNQGAEFVKANGTTVPLRFDNPTPPAIEMAMGYGHIYLFKGEERKRLFEVLPSFYRVDAIRCSAHEYRMFAQGFSDFILSPVLNPWDHAAGCLIAEEAGGVARLLDGTDYVPSLREGRLLVAKSEATWEAIAEALAPADLAP